MSEISYRVIIAEDIITHCPEDSEVEALRPSIIDPTEVINSKKLETSKQEE